MVRQPRGAPRGRRADLGDPAAAQTDQRDAAAEQQRGTAWLRDCLHRAVRQIATVRGEEQGILSINAVDVVNALEALDALYYFGDIAWKVRE